MITGLGLVTLEKVKVLHYRGKLQKSMIAVSPQTELGNLLARPAGSTIFLFIGFGFSLWAPVLMMVPVLLVSTWRRRSQTRKPLLAAGSSPPGRCCVSRPISRMEINGENPKTVYFRYTVNGEEKNEKMDTMSVDEVSTWQPGRKITIKYLNDQATIPELQGVDFPFWIFDLVFGLMSFFFGLMGAALSSLRLTRGLEQNSDSPQRRLYRQGAFHFERGAVFGSAAFTSRRSIVSEVSYSLMDLQSKPVIGRALPAIFYSSIRLRSVRAPVHQRQSANRPGSKALVLDAGTEALPQRRLVASAA